MMISLLILLSNVICLILFGAVNPWFLNVFLLFGMSLMTLSIYGSYKNRDTWDYTIGFAAYRCGFVSSIEPIMFGRRIRTYFIPAFIYRWCFYLETIIFPWRARQMGNFLNSIVEMRNNIQMTQDELLKLLDELREKIRERLAEKPK